MRYAPSTGLLWCLFALVSEKRCCSGQLLLQKFFVVFQSLDLATKQPRFFICPLKFRFQFLDTRHKVVVDRC